jgi:hypothetical protein
MLFRVAKNKDETKYQYCIHKAGGWGDFLLAIVCRQVVLHIVHSGYEVTAGEVAMKSWLSIGCQHAALL